MILARSARTASHVVRLRAPIEWLTSTGSLFSGTGPSRAACAPDDTCPARQRAPPDRRRKVRLGSQAASLRNRESRRPDGNTNVDHFDPLVIPWIPRSCARGFPPGTHIGYVACSCGGDHGEKHRFCSTNPPPEERSIARGQWRATFTITQVPVPCEPGSLPLRREVLAGKHNAASHASRGVLFHRENDSR
jgi:hypothetical protein